MAAILAMETKETMFRDSTSKVIAKLAFDKSRNGTLALLLAGKKRLQLFGDDAVQHRFFRLARDILERPIRHADALNASRHATRLYSRLSNFRGCR